MNTYSQPCTCDECRTGEDQWCCSMCHEIAKDDEA